MTEIETLANCAVQKSHGCFISDCGDRKLVTRFFDSFAELAGMVASKGSIGADTNAALLIKLYP